MHASTKCDVRTGIYYIFNVYLRKLLSYEMGKLKYIIHYLTILYNCINFTIII